MTKEELEDKNCQWLTDIGIISVQRSFDWLLLFNKLVGCKSKREAAPPEEMNTELGLVFFKVLIKLK